MVAPGGHIAVIGGGAAGLAATHRLADDFRVTLIEAAPRLGGHAWTWSVPDGPDRGLPLDLGFMVLNDRNYPNMHALLHELDVRVAPTEMSFGFFEDARALGYVVNGPPAKAPADPIYRRLLGDLLRFQARALADLDAGLPADQTLGSYAASVPTSVVQDYLLPMGAAIWSTAPDRMLEYPARAFLSFFRRHGLLTLEPPPQWQQIPGGAQTYVAALRKRAKGLSVIHSAAARLVRASDHVTVRLGDGSAIRADYAIVAVQADQALLLLDAPAPWEEAGLIPWSYQTNHAVLHTDTAIMPVRNLWASWNARRRGGDLLFTYNLNRLQNHNAQRDYLLTLSPQAEKLEVIARPERLLSTSFRHPVFTAPAISAAAGLKNPAGIAKRTFYCGSYFGYGFHEDAILSGFEAAQAVRDAA